jgi:hypothetical protein
VGDGPSPQTWSLFRQVQHILNVIGSRLRRIDHLALVHARHLAVFLEDMSGDEYPLDVRRLAVENELGSRIQHRREVHPIHVDDDDISLLARSKRSDLLVHPEHLCAIQRGASAISWKESPSAERFSTFLICSGLGTQGGRPPGCRLRAGTLSVPGWSAIMRKS